MEAILLGIYSFFVWLIFIKLKWLPWNTQWQVTVVIIAIVGMAALILLLNVFAPSAADVRVYKYTVPIVSQVRGRVIEVPVEEGNRLVRKGDVLFRIDPTPYELEVKTLTNALGFMLVGFTLNFIIGILAYLGLSAMTRMRRVDAYLKPSFGLAWRRPGYVSRLRSPCGHKQLLAPRVVLAERVPRSHEEQCPDGCRAESLMNLETGNQPAASRGQDQRHQHVRVELVVPVVDLDQHVEGREILLQSREIPAGLPQAGVVMD